MVEKMRNTVLTAIRTLPLLALSACALALESRAHEIDGVAAKVGSETILRSDVYEEMRRAGVRDPSRSEEIRNEMIERKLILKAAADAKMTMQDWVVENRVREIIGKAFGGDRSRLIATLAAQKTSYPEWRARLKEDMVVTAMRWNVVEKNASASPAAMQKEFKENPGKYSSDHRVTVWVIMLKPEEAGRRDEISAALKEHSFAELGGKKYENVNPEELFKPAVCREIASMPKGTISHWIELDGWSFLIRKESEDSGHALSFEEAYDQIEAAVKDADAKRLYEAWIERLKAETYIKVF